MAGEDRIVGGKSFRLRSSQRRDARRQDRGLRVRGALELGRRPVPTERTQIETERGIRFVVYASRIGE
jgi:hypothetical protein